VSNAGNFNMLKDFMEDESSVNIEALDEQEAKDKMISLDKVQALRIKHMARQKKVIAVNEICQLSDELSSDGDSTVDSAQNRASQEEPA